MLTLPFQISCTTRSTAPLMRLESMQTVEGEVFAFDDSADLIALKAPCSKSSKAVTLRIIKASCVKKVSRRTSIGLWLQAQRQLYKGNSSHALTGGALGLRVIQQVRWRSKDDSCLC